jgi:hypothetical protein
VAAEAAGEVSDANQGFHNRRTIPPEGRLAKGKNTARPAKVPVQIAGQETKSRLSQIKSTLRSGA